MIKGKVLYHALAFAVVAVWGVTFICTKVLINAGLTPAEIFAIRFSIAYAGIWGICLCRGEGHRLWSDSLKDELIMAFLGITGGSVYFLAENTALANTNACNVAFIVCIAPLLTVILTLAFRRLLKGEMAEGLEDIKVTPSLVSGTILALFGMALVIFSEARFTFSVKGDLLALGAALCWGLYSVFMSQMTGKYGALFATRKVFFYGLVTIIPVLLSPGRHVSISVFMRPEVAGNLIFLSVAASLACFVAWNKVMSELGNVTSTNYVYLNPFFTLVSAMIFLGERMTLTSAIGSFAIILGVFLACQTPRSERLEARNRQGG